MNLANRSQHWNMVDDSPLADQPLRHFEGRENGKSLGPLMSNDEQRDRLEQQIDTLSAESDRKSQELMRALNRSQEQINRRLDAIDRQLLHLGRRLKGLDLWADVIE